MPILLNIPFNSTEEFDIQLQNPTLILRLLTFIPLNSSLLYREAIQCSD